MKAFEPFINTFSAHGFPPVHLHQHFMRLHYSFIQFVAELDVCTLLHCAVTLPLTLTMFNYCSQFTLQFTCSPCCVSILSMSLKNHAYSHTHVTNCRSDMTSFTELFRHNNMLLFANALDLGLHPFSILHPNNKLLIGLVYLLWFSVLLGTVVNGLCPW